MLLVQDVDKFIVQDNYSVGKVIRKIGDSKTRIVFVVNDFGRLIGSFSDGDLRRWLLSTNEIDINQPIKGIINKKVTKCLFDEKELANDLFSDAVQYIPLVDENDRITAIATLREKILSIGKHSINEVSPSFIIAEIGNNHNGSIELAKKLVDAAAEAGANCAKFQMRDLASLYKNSGNSNDASEDLGSQYVLDLLSRFQLSDLEFVEIFDYCKSRDLEVLCTPFDKVSVDKLDKYGVDAFKIASADLTNHDLLEYIATKNKPMLVSTGMATEDEIIDAVQVLRNSNAMFILLQCNSTYPAPFKDINLKYMNRLKEIGNCFVGYSGHERGIAIPIAAIGMGAKIIEKHFTLDKTMEGNDHKVSLLPSEFREMVNGIRAVEQALGSMSPRKITQGEMMNRETLGKSLIAKLPIKKDQVITADMLDIRSPGKGLAPYRKNDLIGKVAKRDFNEGDFFFPSDLSNNSIKAREYNFSLPFGIPVRYHDVSDLAQKSNLKVLEFHFSYKDLDVDFHKFFDKKNPLNYYLAVHAPELFAGDHTLDLCSLDESYRKHSISELQRVIDITNQLKQYFPKTKKPCIVVNCGGFTSNGFLNNQEKDLRYSILEKSLSELNTEGVELIPQTMPPFPWHFGGQQYHNLFVEADEIVAFCEKNKMRICLDVSHSKLACNFYNYDFETFIAKTSPYSAHYHLADSGAEDDEGLQVGEGTINFTSLFKMMKKNSPQATWIPEIWQGHKNNGEGFWIALDRLEAAEKIANLS